MDNSWFETKNINDNEIEITKYKGPRGDVVIPEEIDGKQVTSIGESAFAEPRSAVLAAIRAAGKEYDRLKHISIPNTVTRIETSAFSLCRTLQEVIIPDSVQYIGPGAFWCCSDLTELHIPNGVQEIDVEAFRDCDGFEKVIIPRSVSKIGDRAFMYCDKLKWFEVEAGTQLKSFGKQCFDGKQKLEEVILHEGCPSSLIKEVFEYAIDKNIEGMLKEEYLKWINREDLDLVLNYAFEKEKTVFISKIIAAYNNATGGSGLIDEI